MYQDYKDLLSAFHAHGVKYLIVGGYAVIFHAQPRATKDLDLFIRADPSNAQATYAALASFGAPLQSVRPLDFAEMKADEYRYWQSRPAHERLDAVEEMIETAYALKGWEIEPDVPRLQRPFVRLPVPWR